MSLKRFLKSVVASRPTKTPHSLNEDLQYNVGLKQKSCSLVDFYLISFRTNFSSDY